MKSFVNYWKEPKTRRANACKGSSSNRRVVAKLEIRPPTQESTVENNITRSEIDNHTDNCCFGANFTPLYFTEQVCDVSPCSDKYNSMSNVEVCAAATAGDDPITGCTSVLEFHQGLWFGSKLPNSLKINPNQCRLFGISLCDDPFDPHRKLEMYDMETGTVISLAMHGSTCHFKSRVPTKLELDTFSRIVMTSDELWDPASLFTQHSSGRRRHTLEWYRV